jgi:predicted component of type VI protein secretion system
MTTGLLIRTLSLNDKPLTQPINGVFDENGGSIGRADANTMTLPDPERLISRMHARVIWGRNAFWIQDVGKGVGSLLNGQAIGTEAPVRLEAQDELQIGGYRLAVEILDQQTVVVLRQQTNSQQRSMRLA